MVSAWSHLPNAAHIDRILADLKANPEKWDMAWDMEYLATRDMAWSAAYNAAYNAAGDKAWEAAYDATGIAPGGAAWDMARGAILALIAYDDCAYLLNTKPEHVKTIALLSVPAAVLLYPAVLALQPEELMV